MKYEEARLQSEQEARARVEQEAQRLAEEFRLRAQAESLRRAEVEARMKEEEARLHSELEARERAEVEAQQFAEESRVKAEEAARRRRAEAEARLIEAEARLQAEHEASARAEAESQRVAEETRQKTEKEALRRAEAEARLIEAEAHFQAEHEASARAEAEAQRLAEETRQKAEEEAIRRAEAEAQLREEEARLQSAQEARAKAEVEAFKIVEESVRFEAEARLRAEAEARLKAEQERLTPDEEDLTDAFAAPFLNEAGSPEYSSSELSWMESTSDQQYENAGSILLPVEDEGSSVAENSFGSADHEGPHKGIDPVFSEKGIVSAEEDGGIPSDILDRLKSPDANVREAALAEVARVGGDDAFRCISRAFDDQSVEVRNAAARALFDLHSDRAATFTRALREGTPERRRKIGQALSASGLAKDAIGNLTGESREKTYDAFSLLFLMAKAGEVQPLMQAIEDYPNVAVRIAVVKLLALSGQPDIIPAFRRMAVRGSLPSEVRSAVMEAIYQIGSQARESAPSAA